MRKHANGGFMKTGYYSLLDTALVLRQVYSVNRFEPFNQALSAIKNKMSQEDLSTIQSIGQVTNGWLKVVECLMEQVLKGMTSPEELLLKAMDDPYLIFGLHGTKDMVVFFSQVWSHYCFAEISKQHPNIMATATELNQYKSNDTLIKALADQSDRITYKDKLLTFEIQPVYKIQLEDIENIIIMPSVFASRHLSYWYLNKSILFYVSIHKDTGDIKGPSDMLLLRTLAFNDKNRLKILKLLSKQAMSVNDIADAIQVNPSTASRHMKIFKDVSYVDLLTKEGNAQYYALNKKKIEQGLNSIHDYILKN